MKDLLDSDDVEKSMEESRKLLGRILIKGESNITSASISGDGSVLVVSTVSAIKAFHLTPSTSSEEELKIRKIQIPPSIESAGANLVEISPNGQWLSWIQDGTKVLTTRVSRDNAANDSEIIFHPRPAKLTRLRRDIAKNVRLGGLGNYERHVTHIAFSPDSSILATADLAGYVDTWVLRAGGLTNGASVPQDDDAASGSSDLSDSDSEHDEQPESGPRWVRNPKTALFPKLSHAPVVLSFSQDALGPSLSGEGGSADGYVLLAVTTTSRIYTFHPLEGSLTRWSRRNGVWKLPEEIRVTRDLIKGAIWQGSRIWMYGTSFLFMLDISLDYSQDVEAAAQDKKRNRKRKRGDDSGAGSKMESGQAHAPQHVRVALAEDGKTGEWVDVEMADAESSRINNERDDSDDDDNDADDDEMDGGELQKLRDRESSHREGAETSATSGGEEGKESKGGKPRNWWHTYKYRPILGIVPMASEEHDSELPVNGVNGNGKKKKSSSKKAVNVPPPLEVALVERPKWDVDMPARYVED